MQPAVGALGATLALVLAAAIGVLTVGLTGAPVWAVGLGVFGWGILTVLTYRSGGRFEFQVRDARPLSPRDPPEIRRALLQVCERAGRPVPDPRIVELDAPGMMVGYANGEPVVGIDPGLPRVVGSHGMAALFAHELGHLETDLATDALRKFCPQVIGFSVFWYVILFGRGPVVATVGTVVYLGLVPLDQRPSTWVRYGLSLGVEPVAVAASRYANRQEEYVADEVAAQLVTPDAMTEALYRVAAVATGKNQEDVAGPIPWNADRSMRFALFATHPTVEDRAAALGCTIPDWVRPYRPHRAASAG